MDTGKQQKWWRVLFAIGLAGLFALSFFAGPHSEPDDDWTIAYLVAGRMGELGMNPHVEPVLMQVLKMLFQAIPWLNVYEAFRIVMVMGAFIAIALSLFRMMPSAFAFFLSVLFVFIYWNDTMVRYNYTFSVGLCGGAAILLLYCYGTGRMKKAAAIWGGILWLLAFCWRREAALLLVPYGMLILFSYGLRVIYKKSDLRHHRKQAVALMMIALLNGVIILSSGIFWNQPDWKEYKRFNRARVAVVDYSLAPWADAKEQLEPLGITENDYWCAQNWILADPEVFSVEQMEALAEQKIPTSQNGDFPQTVIHYFLRAPFRIRACSAFGLAALLVLITGGIWQWLTVFCAAGGSCVISLYFLWQGRLIDRVEAVIWLGALCVAVTQIRSVHRRGVKMIGAGCAVAGMLLLAVTGGRMLPLQSPNGLLKAEFEVANPVALETMKEDRYYLWNVVQEDLIWTNTYENVHLPTAEFFRHNGGLGGWTEGSPALASLRKDLGIINPMRALVENENVYLVDPHTPDRILRFVQEHYEPSATLSAAQQLNENTWALKITPPIQSNKTRVVEWSLQCVDSIENWHTVRGTAKGLGEIEQLWVKVENAMGTSRCYRLMDQGEGNFCGELYVDWADLNEEFSYTLLWQENGEIWKSTVRS